MLTAFPMMYGLYASENINTCKYFFNLCRRIKTIVDILMSDCQLLIGNVVMMFVVGSPQCLHTPAVPHLNSTEPDQTEGVWKQRRWEVDADRVAEVRIFRQSAA